MKAGDSPSYESAAGFDKAAVGSLIPSQSSISLNDLQGNG